MAVTAVNAAKGAFPTAVTLKPGILLYGTDAPGKLFLASVIQMSSSSLSILAVFAVIRTIVSVYSVLEDVLLATSAVVVDGAVRMMNTTSSLRKGCRPLMSNHVLWTFHLVLVDLFS